MVFHLVHRPIQGALDSPPNRVYSSSHTAPQPFPCRRFRVRFHPSIFPRAAVPPLLRERATQVAVVAAATAAAARWQRSRQALRQSSEACQTAAMSAGPSLQLAQPGPEARQKALQSAVELEAPTTVLAQYPPPHPAN